MQKIQNSNNFQKSHQQQQQLNSIPNNQQQFQASSRNIESKIVKRDSQFYSSSKCMSNNINKYSEMSN